LAEFLAKERSVESAEKQLLASIEKYPNMYELRFGLAGLYDQIKKPDMAEIQFRKIIDGAGTGPLGLKARIALANQLLTQGEPVEEPEKLISEVLKENPRDNDALLMKGKLSLAKGQPQDAIVAFRTILKDEPSSVEVLTLLGDAHLRNGEMELAKENLLKAVKFNPENPKAQLLLTRYYARTGDYDAALKKTDEVLKVSPKNHEALQARVEIFAAKRDQAGLQAAILRVKESYPDDPRSYYQLGQYYFSQKKFDAAIREFDSALVKSEATILEPLVGIVNAHVAQGKPELAINRLTGLIKQTPNHPYAHELLAQLYFGRKEYAEAEKHSRDAIKANPGWNLPYMTLANMHVARNELAAAEEVYQQGLKTASGDVELMLHLAQFHERTGNFTKAASTYELVLQQNQSLDIAANNLASLLTDRLGDPESLKKAKTLAERFESSRQPAFRDTLGWVYYKTGEVDKAVTVLKDVVKQAPNVSIFRYHLGMAYHKQGNLSEAKIQLAKAIESKSDFTGKDEARKTLQQIP
jgi:tetratricopeptide (TPR) repeat protein